MYIYIYMLTVPPRPYFSHLFFFLVLFSWTLPLSLFQSKSSLISQSNHVCLGIFVKKHIFKIIEISKSWEENYIN